MPSASNTTPKRVASSARSLSIVHSRVSAVSSADASKATSVAPHPVSMCDAN